MHAVLAHALMFVFAAALARFGRFLAHDLIVLSVSLPSGTEPAFGKRFALSWSRVASWFFSVGGCLGCVLYLVLSLSTASFTLIETDLVRPPLARRQQERIANEHLTVGGAPSLRYANLCKRNGADHKPLRITKVNAQQIEPSALPSCAD
jgi:hypothetical protein